LLRRYPPTTWITLACRLILGVVLLVAGLLKLPDLEASVLSVRLYQILPFGWTPTVGYALPILEVAFGVLLVAGVFTRWSAVVGSLMMLAYIIAISSVWARGISIDCGCFSAGKTVDPTQTQYPLEVARDIGLLALGVWTVIRPKSPFAVDAWLFASPLPDDDEPEELDDEPGDGPDEKDK